MANSEWRGDAPAVAQVNTFTLAGTWEVGDKIKVDFLMPDGTTVAKSWTYTTASTVAATIAAAFVAAWNLLDGNEYPEFAEITASLPSGADVTLTADTAGKPFVLQMTPLESDGSPADAQTIAGSGTATTGTATTASSGPNHWDTAANWTLGAIPANTNNIYVGPEAVILYGLNQSGVTLASLTIARGAKIGLPPIVNEGNDNEYWEYRPLDLAIGATLQDVGRGAEFAGSDRVNIDNGSVQTTLNVYSSGNAESAANRTHAIFWKGTHASNVVNFYQGSLAIASRPGEVATVLTLRQSYVSQIDSDTNLKIGAGVTLTGSGEIDKNGGDTEVNCAVTTIVMAGGKLTTLGTGAISAITVRDGTATLNSTGTITTLVWSGSSIIDFSKSMVARTVSNAERYGTATLKDPFKVVVFTNGIDSHESDMSNLDLGRDIRITRGVIS